MKNITYRIFRTAYTIVWALLITAVILLTMLNHEYLIDDLGYGVLVGIAVIASYVMILVWNVQLIPPENGQEI